MLSIFSKIGNVLVTAQINPDSTKGFVPGTQDWTQETVDISAYSTETNAQFKFEFRNDWENNFYLDDIMLAGGGAGAVNDISIDAFVTVFPNPSNGNVNVDLAIFDLGQTDVIVYNMLGEEVEHVSHNVISPKRVKFNLEEQPNGVYFVKVQTEHGVATKKLVLNK